MTKSRLKGTIIEKQLGIPADYQYKAIRSGNFFQSNWHNNKLIAVEGLIRPNMKILDLGTGSGNFEFRFAKSVAKIVGVDYNDEALAFLKKTLNDKKIKNVTLRQADIRSIGQAGIAEKFDLIVMMDVIEHIRIGEAKAMLKQLTKMLNPRGWICIITPNYKSSWRILERLLDLVSAVPKLEDEQHLAKYDPKNLEEILESAGLVKERIGSFNLFSFLVPGKMAAGRLCRLELKSGITYGNLLWGLFEAK